MTTFEAAKKSDLDHALSMLMHDSRHKLEARINEIKGDAIKHGALQSNRVVVMAVDAANKQHEEAIGEAKGIIFGFIERLRSPPREIVESARPHLESLGNSLLGLVPPNGFPADRQRLVAQYRAVFGQRLDGILRNIEIGFVGQSGFQGSAAQDEWVSAKEALAILAPSMKSFSAHQAICARAHAGILRARAATFMRDEHSSSNAEIPKQFWWAEGHAALTQNWETGDFETWLDHKVRLRAFSVEFLRLQITSMVSTEAPAVAPPSPRRCAVLLTALHVESKAVLRHVTNYKKTTITGGTVFFVGDFGEWKIAVAECGEGNATAAGILAKAASEFKPEIALFVGVAGGLKDVAIGDVIVSTKVYGYERGKDTEAGFKPRPDVFVADHGIEQQARALRHENEWHARLDNPSKPGEPRLFVGPIAAGEKVVVSARSETGKLLRATYSDALGVEMEGAGFLNGVHISAPVQGAVIRGVSDLMDGKTAADESGSQERAADAASAVAFAILAALVEK